MINARKINSLGRLLLATIMAVILPAAIDIASAATAPHTITVAAPSNGTISPSGPVSVADGKKKIFTIRPDKGYYIQGIMIDDAVINLSTDTNFKKTGRVGKYTFKNVTTDHTIAVTFALLPKLTVMKENSGTVKNIAAGINCGKDCEQQFDIGKTVTLTAYPSKDYAFSSWTGCNASSSNPKKCTLTMSEDTIVTAAFKTTATLQITPSVASIKPGGAQEFCASFINAKGKGPSNVTYNWSISDDSIVTVQNFGNTIFVKGNTPGTVEVTASGNGVSSTSTLTIAPSSSRPKEIVLVYPNENKSIPAVEPGYFNSHHIDVQIDFSSYDCRKDDVDTIKLFVDNMDVTNATLITNIESHLAFPVCPAITFPAVVELSSAVDSEDTIRNTCVLYRTNEPFSIGEHEAKIEIDTKLGNFITHTWTFQVVE